MIIKRITIKNFGKLHNRTLEFSPGMNVLYGENESGKTTTHTFVKSMLYGIHRQRGRAARKDAYTIYLPWENPSVYGGTLWFESGGKSFRLTRNFYKDDLQSQLLCEDDGELLDIEQGDLDAVLGGVSETVYENTVSIAQLKSTTGVELVREVQNYMASYQGAGDSSVDLGRTAQMLKMNRKGFQVQADRRRKKRGLLPIWNISRKNWRIWRKRTNRQRSRKKCFMSAAGKMNPASWTSVWSFWKSSLGSKKQSSF